MRLERTSSPMETRKIVINVAFGGFSLSPEALKAIKAKGLELDLDEVGSAGTYIQRDLPELVQVVEELGTESYGSHAKLRVVEIPADVAWEIYDYDGLEHIAEKHRIWYA